MRKLLSVLLIAMMVAIAAGCGTNNNAGNQANTNAVQNEAASAAEHAANETDIVADVAGETADEAAGSKKTVYPLTVKDASGIELTFNQAPERIVSTSPSETEILFALGLADKIVGVSDYDNYPEEALSKPKVGGVWNPNVEAIIAAEADLVIGGLSLPEDVTVKFRELDVIIYKTDPKQVEDVLTNIQQLGMITNTQEQAEALVEKMKADILKVTDAVAAIKDVDKKKVYLEFAPGWTVGSGELLHELLTIAGGINIAQDVTGWNEINEEKIIQDNPDVILYAADLIDFDSGKPLDEIIKNRSGWDQIKAIQDSSLSGISDDVLSRPGPRITEGLLLMFEGIYPGLISQ